MSRILILVALFALNVGVTGLVSFFMTLAFGSLLTGQNKGWVAGRVIFSVLFLFFVPLVFVMWVLWGTIIVQPLP